MMNSNNNFDFLRLVAAILVFFSHNYLVYGFPKEPEMPFASYLSLGGANVSVFFVISGYLITASRENSVSVKAYAIKRLLRIVPALWICLLLIWCVLGPVVSTLNWHDYWAHHDTPYFILNFILPTINGRLPGVFLQQGEPGAVNGSLWTLSVEILLYILIGAMGIQRRRLWILYGLLWLLLIANLAYPQSFPAYIKMEHGGLPVFPMLHHSLLFVSGALLYLHREQCRRYTMAAVICCLALLTLNTFLPISASWQAPLFVAAFPYLVVAIAYAPLGSTIRQVGRYGDFSYGLYIYAYPVQKLCFMWVGDRLGFVGYTLLSLLIIFGCAVLSWQLVEKRALEWKRRLLSNPL